MTFDGIGISFGIGLGFGWDDPPPPATTPQSSPKSGTSSYSSSPSKWDPAWMVPFVSMSPPPAPQSMKPVSSQAAAPTLPPEPPRELAVEKK